MRELSESRQVYDEIDAIKRIAPAFATNCFSLHTRLQQWLDRKLLTGIRLENAFLLFQQDEGFHRLHFFATEPNALAAALGAKETTTYETVVCDIVGRPIDVDTMAGRFEGHGFHRYCLLHRLTRVNASAESATGGTGVTLATPEDSAVIVSALRQHFDPRAEQLPAASEIDEAVRRAQILVSRKDGKIAGFLYFEINGQTGIVRYWFVDPLYRDAGVGAALMRNFFERCRLTKRQLLWVIESNRNAIARYCHYGFSADNLCDQVMLKQRS